MQSLVRAGPEASISRQGIATASCRALCTSLTINRKLLLARWGRTRISAHTIFPMHTACLRAGTKHRSRELLPLEVKCKPHLQAELVAPLLSLHTTTAGSHLGAELGHVVLAGPETQTVYRPQALYPMTLYIKLNLYKNTNPLSIVPL